MCERGTLLVGLTGGDCDGELELHALFSLITFSICTVVLVFLKLSVCAVGGVARALACSISCFGRARPGEWPSPSRDHAICHDALIRCGKTPIYTTPFSTPISVSLVFIRLRRCNAMSRCSHSDDTCDVLSRADMLSYLLRYPASPPHNVDLANI